MTDPTSCIQIIDALRPGGAERVAVLLANALAERSIASGLVTSRELGSLVSEAGDNVVVQCVGRTRRIDLRAAARLRRIVREQRAEVVDVHGSSIYFAGMALRGRRRPAIVWHDHNARLGERSWWLGALARLLADETVVVSEDIARWHAMRQVPFLRTSTTVIPNFVEVSPRGPLPVAGLAGAKDNRVIVVGNLRPEKDHVGTIRAFRSVVDAHPDAVLLCAGAFSQPDVLAEVEAEIERLQLHDHVQLLGPRGDVWDLLGASSVAVLFSKSEGHSVALLEYGRAGLPAVASAVGGAPVLANATEGVRLVRSGDEASLAAEIVALLDDQVRARELGADFRRIVDRDYSEAAILPSLLAVYRAAIEHR